MPSLFFPTGWFGTFLFNSERERTLLKIADCTFSIWDYLLSNPRTFENPSFSPTKGILIPVGSVRGMKFWSEYYLRYDKMFHTRFSAKPKEEEGDFEEPLKPRIVLWLPDDAAVQCHNCLAPFHFLFRRKHHCRNCGYIFCSSCVESRANLHFLGYETPQRVCSHCFALLHLPNMKSRGSASFPGSRRGTLEWESDGEGERSVSPFDMPWSLPRRIELPRDPSWRADVPKENVRRFTLFGGHL